MDGSGGGTEIPHASAGDVEAFLGRFKIAMDANGLNLWKSKKSQDFMLEHGLTAAHVQEAIRELGYRQYHRGPMPDDDPSRARGEVWVFQTEYFGLEVYLKLKLVGPAGSPHQAACLSFHEPARGMTTPLKINGRGPSRPTRRKGR